eukprot:tig00000269_g23703.t1
MDSLGYDVDLTEFLNGFVASNSVAPDRDYETNATPDDERGGGSGGGPPNAGEIVQKQLANLQTTEGLTATPEAAGLEDVNGIEVAKATRDMLAKKNPNKKEEPPQSAQGVLQDAATGAMATHVQNAVMAAALGTVGFDVGEGKDAYETLQDQNEGFGDAPGVGEKVPKNEMETVSFFMRPSVYFDMNLCWEGEQAKYPPGYWVVGSAALDGQDALKYFFACLFTLGFAASFLEDWYYTRFFEKPSYIYI